MTDTLTAPSARTQVAPRHLTGPQDLDHPLIVRLLERAAGFENGGGVPVISAGDGPGQHPTQALLDLYTIKKELGRLDHLRIGLAGDLRNGRTARSLADLLSRFAGNELVLIAPPGLRMGEDVLRSVGPQLRVRETADLAEAAPTLDVLYQTRIQAERFESPAEYERERGR